MGEREPLRGVNRGGGKGGEDILSPQVMSAPRSTQSLRKGFFW